MPRSQVRVVATHELEVTVDAGTSGERKVDMSTAHYFTAYLEFQNRLKEFLLLISHWKIQEPERFKKLINYPGEWWFVVPIANSFMLARSDAPEVLELMELFVGSLVPNVEYPTSRCIFKRTFTGKIEVVKFVEIGSE